MNQTEAWEVVFLAAQLAADAWGVPTGRSNNRPIIIKLPGGEEFNLRAALKKVSPRVQRMRARLDFIRARKAGKLNRPSWATP